MNLLGQYNPIYNPYIMKKVNLWFPMIPDKVGIWMVVKIRVPLWVP